MQRLTVVFAAALALGLAVVGEAADSILLTDAVLQPDIDKPAAVEMAEATASPSEWCWQALPEGLLFPAYLAGPRESRLGSQWSYVTDLNWVWDLSLGARVGLLRLGTNDAVFPQGIQFDVEGAAFPRLAYEQPAHLYEVGILVGAPITFRSGCWEGKFGVYHYSSHLGDEWMVYQGSFDRRNYTRNSLVAAIAFRPVRPLRIYFEGDYAFDTDGGSEPWILQLGAEYSPISPTDWRGAPFMAFHGRLREEEDFGGSFTAQVGWQWRNVHGRLARIGMHFMTGQTDWVQFMGTNEKQVGIGIWYDF